MDNVIQQEAEAKDLKYENSVDSMDGVETNEETSIKNQDTLLGMIVLLLTCLALAALAHVIV